MVVAGRRLPPHRTPLGPDAVAGYVDQRGDVDDPAGAGQAADGVVHVGPQVGLDLVAAGDAVLQHHVGHDVGPFPGLDPAHLGRPHERMVAQHLGQLGQ